MQSVRTQQPVSWTSIPSTDTYETECLKTVNSLSINHGFSFRQADVSMQAKYGIFNDRGEQFFSAFEESDLLQRTCCANDRKFTMHILDNNNRELIRVHRELQRCSGCCWCSSYQSCMQQATVESPPGHIIGTVQQEGNACSRIYVIQDANNTPMLTIMGPCCICNGIYSCGCENRFALLGIDRSTEIGAIDKKYLDSMKLNTANPVAFTLNFPLDLDVKMKILILAAVFFIDIATYPINRLRN